MWDYRASTWSHFGFLSRWLERDGVYYWFEQGDGGEKMLASDTRIAHMPMPGHETFHYAPPTGLDATLADEVVKNFTLKRTPMPKSLLVKDYNYEKPSLDLTGRAMVADKGRGDLHLRASTSRTWARATAWPRCGPTNGSAASRCSTACPTPRQYARAMSSTWTATTARTSTRAISPSA